MLEVWFFTEPSDIDSASPISRYEQSTLCSQGFLDLADFLLDFPAYLFVLAFGFQVRIIRHMSRLLLDLSLHFVNLPRYLVLGTWLQFVTSFENI
jgi:hypothetical protein